MPETPCQELPAHTFPPQSLSQETQPVTLPMSPKTDPDSFLVRPCSHGPACLQPPPRPLSSPCIPLQPPWFSCGSSNTPNWFVPRGFCTSLCLEHSPSPELGMICYLSLFKHHPLREAFSDDCSEMCSPPSVSIPLPGFTS